MRMHICSHFLQYSLSFEHLPATKKEMEAVEILFDKGFREDIRNLLLSIYLLDTDIFILDLDMGVKPVINHRDIFSPSWHGLGGSQLQGAIIIFIHS